MCSSKVCLKNRLKQFIRAASIIILNTYSTKFLQTASLNGFFKCFGEKASLNVSFKDSVKGSFKGSFQRFIRKVACKGFFKAFP